MTTYVHLCKTSDGRLWYMEHGRVRYYDPKLRKNVTFANIRDILNRKELWLKLPEQVRKRLIELGYVPRLCVPCLENLEAVLMCIEEHKKKEEEEKKDITSVLYYVHVPSYHIKKLRPNPEDETRVEPAKIRDIDKALRSIAKQLQQLFLKHQCPRIEADMYYDARSEKVCKCIRNIFGKDIDIEHVGTEELVNRLRVKLPDNNALLYIVTRTKIAVSQQGLKTVRTFEVNVEPLDNYMIREVQQETMAIESASLKLAELCLQYLNMALKSGAITIEEYRDAIGMISQKLFVIISSSLRVRELAIAAMCNMMGIVPIIDHTTHTKLVEAVKGCIDPKALKMILRGDYSYALKRQLNAIIKGQRRDYINPQEQGKVSSNGVH